MIELIAVLIVLWLLGIIRIPWLTMPHFTAFSILGISITLEKLLIFVIIIWLATSLGSPFRQILWAFVVIWLLSIFGIVLISNMVTLAIIALVVGLVLSMSQKGN